MKTFFKSALNRTEIVIDFVEGVDRTAFQPQTLSSAELDSIHQTMAYWEDEDMAVTGKYEISGLRQAPRNI